jgi:hypothetical protein
MKSKLSKKSIFSSSRFQFNFNFSGIFPKLGYVTKSHDEVERRQCLTPEREFLGLVSTQER